MTTQLVKAQRWERMPDEGAKPWAAFLIYRNMGVDRSIDKAYCVSMGRAEGSSRASGRWNVWNSAWAWKARAAAFDAHLEKEAVRGLAHTATENKRTRIRNITNVQNSAMLILHKADLGNLDSTEARKLLPLALRALDETAESLREEFGVAARPTTSRELVVSGTLEAGQVQVEDFDDDELLTKIAAREQGFDDDVDGEVNGRGEFIPTQRAISQHPSG